MCTTSMCTLQVTAGPVATAQERLSVTRDGRAGVVHRRAYTYDLLALAARFRTLG
jgi:hypothetical protein